MACMQNYNNILSQKSLAGEIFIAIYDKPNSSDIEVVKFL
jgi:hypothetical protein